MIKIMPKAKDMMPELLKLLSSKDDTRETKKIRSEMGKPISKRTPSKTNKPKIENKKKK